MNNEKTIERMLQENVFHNATAQVEAIFETGESSIEYVCNGYCEETQSFKYITTWYAVSDWFSMCLEEDEQPVLYYGGANYWGLAGSGIAMEQRGEVERIFQKHYCKEQDNFWVIDADYISKLVKSKKGE